MRSFILIIIFLAPLRVLAQGYFGLDSEGGKERPLSTCSILEQVIHCSTLGTINNKQTGGESGVLPGNTADSDIGYYYSFNNLESPAKDYKW